MAIPPDASDRSLLDALRRGRDAAALAEVVRRYGGLVYGVCLRRAGPVGAASACITVFRDLLQHADVVGGALPLWLHRAALARGDGGPGQAPVQAEPEWQALAPAIDPAIAGLAPLARWHVLTALATLPARAHAQAQAREIAGPLAGPVAAAVGQLAAGLAGTGTIVDAARLAELLDRNLIELPPPAVAAGLGRLALGALPATSPLVETPAGRRAKVVWGITIGGLVYVLIVAVAIWGLAAWYAHTHPHEERAAPSSSPTGP